MQGSCSSESAIAAEPFMDSAGWNNLFGAGNPYNPNSPTNPYGRGLRIEGR
jgi:hypothetical protein